MHIKVDQNKTRVDLNSLAICKEIAKLDQEKLAQKEVSSILGSVGFIEPEMIANNDSSLSSLIDLV